MKKISSREASYSFPNESDSSYQMDKSLVQIDSQRRPSLFGKKGCPRGDRARVKRVSIWLLIIGAGVFSLALVRPVQAAVTYSRSPSGFEFPPPLNVSVTVGSFSDFNQCGYLQNPQYWDIEVNSELGTVTTSGVFASTTLSASVEFNLSDGNYVQVMANISETPNVFEDACASTDLEVNPDRSTIFRVKGHSGTPGGGPVVHTPVVELKTALKDQYLNGTISIDYLAYDPDHGRLPAHGLIESPVDIFYRTASDTDWFVLAENLEAQGSFQWDSKIVPDGQYELRLVVTGADEDFSETKSGIFVIDNTPPNFLLKVTPTFATSGPIFVEILSSENLMTPPYVAITQFGREPFVIIPQGIGKEFKIIYEPFKGYDGLAKITVVGTDLASNSSDLVISGDTFAVGVEPPKSPAVEGLIDGASVTSSPITINGSAINAAKVTVLVNKTKEYVASTSPEGIFTVEGVELDPKFNAGKNVVRISVKDLEGRSSLPTEMFVTLNSAPIVQLKELRKLGAKQEVLKGQVKISWSATDINNDPLTYNIELSEDEGQTWQAIATDLKETEYLWQTEEAPDSSNYLLRVVANDGLVNGFATSRKFSVQNNLPIIVLDVTDQSRAFITESNRTFSGFVRSKEDLLQKLEVSFDGGKTWQQVLATDGAFESAFERFSFSVPKLPVGRHTITLRGFTKSGRSVINAKRLQILFDDIAPQIVLSAKEVQPTKNPLISLSGAATDDFSGIAAVEYFIDNGQWLKATVESGYETQSVTFIIKHPVPLVDGVHIFSVRSVDRAGNVSVSVTQKVVVDTTPPRAGSFMLTIGKISLLPDQEGIFEILPNKTVHLKMAIGGQPSGVQLFANNAMIPITFKPEVNLWESELIFESGEIDLTVVMKDGLGNAAKSPLAKIKVVSSGKVTDTENKQALKEAIVTIYQQDQDKQWFVWDGLAYDQINPHQTGSDGGYSLLLPFGTYQLRVSAPGYQSVRTKPFEVKNPSIVRLDISLEKQKGFSENLGRLLERIFR